MVAVREKFSFVIVGHVDHGKSTIVGRLLADSGSLPDGKLDQVKENCLRNSKPFEYAFLIDALKDEQSQGITIDAARVFFKSARRDYIILDAPGHIEFLKNMVTGASRAEAALLVIDAREGVMENSRRHGYVLSLLGIKTIIVLVNKMDLVDNSQERFERIREEFGDFLAKINVKPLLYIPVSGRQGENIVQASPNMPWHTEGTVLEALDSLEKEKPLLAKPFRMPLQDVYKFTALEDDRRICAGTVLSGRLAAGDTVVFYPSGKRSVVKKIERFNAAAIDSVKAGNHAGFTLQEQIYVKRGEIAAKLGEEPPKVSTRVRVSIFWLGKNPLVARKEYLIKIGSAKVKARVESITRVMDASDLHAEEGRKHIDQHEVAECVLALNREIAFDVAETLASSSRFVIVDEYDIRGGGIVLEALSDAQHWVREHVMLRNYKWEKSMICPEARAERYNQKAVFLLITGPRNVGKKLLAKQVEKSLFEAGKLVYFLGIGNVLYGIDADIKDKARDEYRQEHIRRMAELSYILLDAGMILIVTAVELTQADLETIKTSIIQDQIIVTWVGEEVTTDIDFDLQVAAGENPQEFAVRIRIAFQERGIIFRP